MPAQDRYPNFTVKGSESYLPKFLNIMNFGMDEQ